jgi:hypothetical protein
MAHAPIVGGQDAASSFRLARCPEQAGGPVLAMSRRPFRRFQRGPHARIVPGAFPAGRQPPGGLYKQRTPPDQGPSSVEQRSSTGGGLAFRLRFLYGTPWPPCLDHGGRLHRPRLRSRAAGGVPISAPRSRHRFLSLWPKSGPVFHVSRGDTSPESAKCRSGHRLAVHSELT